MTTITDLTTDDAAALLGGYPEPLPEEEADLRAAQGAAAMAAMRAGVRARAAFVAANPAADVLAADAAERAAVSCWWGRFAAYAEGRAEE